MAQKWPGPLALSGVLLVAQNWPVGKQEVKVIHTVFADIHQFSSFNFCMSVINSAAEKHAMHEIDM